MLESTVKKGATLWATVGQTPATTALGLKTIQTSGDYSSRPERATIAKLVVLSVLLPTVYRQLRLWNASMESSMDTDDDYTYSSDDSVTRIARERQQMLVRKILEMVDRTLPALRLYALLAWWMGKRGAAPTLAMTLA